MVPAALINERKEDLEGLFNKIVVSLFYYYLSFFDTYTKRIIQVTFNTAVLWEFVCRDVLVLS